VGLDDAGVAEVREVCRGLLIGRHRLKLESVMIDLLPYKLRPPLREPVSEAQPEVAPSHNTSPSRIPPSPPKGISTDNTHPERIFVCCVCSKRAVGQLPYGWVRVLRSVHPKSLPLSGLLIRYDRKGRPKYADSVLGICCGADCMERVLARLTQVVRDLEARDVGMRPLAPGENPPDLPLMNKDRV
jgi:hypothetical protein